MKKKLVFTLFLAAFLAATLFSGNGQTAAMNDVIPIQGKLSDATGNPLNGSYTISASIYNVASGGVALCTDADPVTVTNGLFVFEMDFCTPTDLSGSEQLYLGIKVGSDPEMTPRRPIFANPFAWGIRANTIGGDIKQPVTNHGLVKAGVYVDNCGLFPSIAQSFNNVNTAIITVSSGGAAGSCTVDFGFDVSTRYIAVTSRSSTPRIVTFLPAASINQINLYKFDAAGAGITGDLLVLVY